MHINPTNRRAALVAAAALALGSATARAETEHALIGTWSATWPSGVLTELTLTGVTDAGDAYGAYCNRGRNFFVFTDLHPTEGIPARVKDGVLRFQLGKNTKLGFRPDADDSDFLELTHRRGGKERTLHFERSDAERCLDRVAPLAAAGGTAPAATVATAPREGKPGWLLGTWTGTWPNGLTVELTVTRIDEKRNARGIYCNLREGPITFVYDLHPETAVKARTSRNGVKFRINKIQFAFKKTADDAMRITRRQSGKKTTLDVVRTDEPACANRVTLLSGT